MHDLRIVLLFFVGFLLSTTVSCAQDVMERLRARMVKTQIEVRGIQNADVLAALQKVERHLVAIGAEGFALIPTAPQWRPPYLGRMPIDFCLEPSDFEWRGDTDPRAKPAPGGLIVRFSFCS